MVFMENIAVFWFCFMLKILDFMESKQFEKQILYTWEPTYLIQSQFFA